MGLFQGIAAPFARIVGVLEESDFFIGFFYKEQKIYFFVATFPHYWAWFYPFTDPGSKACH